MADYTDPSHRSTDSDQAHWRAIVTNALAEDTLAKPGGIDVLEARPSRRNFRDGDRTLYRPDRSKRGDFAADPQQNQSAIRSVFRKVAARYDAVSAAAPQRWHC